jgi:hypothetical protein
VTAKRAVRFDIIGPASPSQGGLAEQGRLAGADGGGDEMTNRVEASKPRLGVFGIGLAAYWPQFPGLNIRSHPRV